MRAPGARYGCIRRSDGGLALSCFRQTGRPVASRTRQPAGACPTERRLLAAQIAAWVRFLAWILRRIAFTCTFTVASVISKRRAISLFESPASGTAG